MNDGISGLVGLCCNWKWRMQPNWRYSKYLHFHPARNKAPSYASHIQSESNAHSNSEMFAYECILNIRTIMKNRTFHFAAMELFNCIKSIDMQTWPTENKIFVNFCMQCARYARCTVHGVCFKVRIIAINAELLTFSHWKSG